MGFREVQEDEHGLYIWMTDDGRRVADENGNTMNIPSKKGDLDKIEKLRQAARYYGVPGGKPVFLASRRRVTESEYEHQLERLEAGLVPDPLDFHAMKEQAEYAKKYGT